jgi:chaperone required for assembly of F1-ATPase
VSVDPDQSGYGVLLDGRPARTPAGRPLRVPTPDLASAIAAEWRAQDAVIDLHAMPLTQLAATALDRVGPDRQAVIESIVDYAETDLVCYWADQPPDLTDRQRQLWAPLLDWAEEQWGVRMAVAAGVMPIVQPAEALDAVRVAIAGLSDLALTALSSAAAAAGSVIVGLALVKGRLDADGAFAVALLDECYQAERWGEDEEAARRRRQVHADLCAAAKLVRLSGRAADAEASCGMREDEVG